MFLTDLLPSIFDTVVLQLTRRELLWVERDAILTALVNCVGESVMRQVRAAPHPVYIESITTTDHFSDEWLARSEIVDSIDKSSGLGRELAEFALFLLEIRLDLNAGENGLKIAEIGTMSPIKSRSRGGELDLQEITRRLWFAFLQESPDVESQFYLTEFLQGAAFALPKNLAQTLGRRRNSARRLLEASQLIASLGRQEPYKIFLSDGVSYKQRGFFYQPVQLGPPHEGNLGTDVP
jgi:hypothetical protein